MDTSPGVRLALLLHDGFNAMVQEVVAELALQGHPGVTATHEFALSAIDEGADSASALGRRLGVSKQAAAKTISALEQLGYVERTADPDDARRIRLGVTARGYELSAIGSAKFNDIRARWTAQLATGQAGAVEDALLRLLNREAGALRPGDVR